MGFWVGYKGENRAYCNVTTKPTSMENTTKTTKYNIEFVDLKSIELLFKLDSTDIISVDDESMNYQRFKEEILQKANRIYTFRNASILDSEFTAELTKKGLNKVLRDKEAHEKLESMLNSSELSKGNIQIIVSKIN